MKKGSGLCSVSFRGLTVAEIIETTKTCGLDCIEWGGDVHVPVGDIENARQVKDLTISAGLKLSSYGTYFKVGIDQDFSAVSETAKALGTDVIRVWAGDKDCEDFTEVEYQNLVSELKRCADIAKSNGQTIAFEYHYVTYCNKADAILKLISDAGKDNVKSYWQPAYWLQGLTEQERVEYNLNEIEKLKHKIVNAHVYAWRGHQRFELANDKDEWQKYFNALPDVNGYLEFVKDDMLEQLKKDAKQLISL